MIEKYRPIESTQFKKGRKLAGKRGLDMSMLKWGIAHASASVAPCYPNYPNLGADSTG